MRIALCALRAGFRRVMRAPGTVAAVVLVTLAGAVPFGLVMGQRLQSAWSEPLPVAERPQQIDANWWRNFRDAAQGLSTTFTPAIIGVAAPLSNLSALLDGTPPATAMALPLTVAILSSAFVWGWAIERYRSGGSRRMTDLVSAALRALPRFITISAASLAVQVLLYVTVHRVLFGPVYSTLTSGLSDERLAFAIRVALYAAFGACLAAVSLAADYSRIASRLPRKRPARHAVAASLAFMTQQPAAVAGLFLIGTAILGSLFALYAAGTLYGGSHVGGWRGVAIGEAFIISRVGMRLIAIASEVDLFEGQMAFSAAADTSL